MPRVSSVLLLAVLAICVIAAPTEFIGFTQRSLDATNNFTLITWTPQGNVINPIASYTYAQIGVPLTQAVMVDSSTGLVAFVGVDFKTVKNSVYLLSPEDGSIKNSWLFSEPLPFIELDTETGLLYSISIIQGRITAVSINLQSGKLSSIMTVNCAGPALPSLSSYNQQEHRLYFVASNDKGLTQLVSYDVHSGSLVGTIKIENAPYALAYNPNDGLLYMLWPNLSDNGTALASVDLSTGAITNIIDWDSEWAYGPLAFDSTYTSLYGVITHNQNSGTTSQVYVMDPSNGNTTIVKEPSVFAALRAF